LEGWRSRRVVGKGRLSDAAWRVGGGLGG
jgi:hypothetical protein